MKIAWIYNKSLNTGIGGTERTTMLAIEMLQEMGHKLHKPSFIIMYV